MNKTKLLLVVSFYLLTYRVSVLVWCLTDCFKNQFTFALVERLERGNTAYNRPFVGYQNPTASLTIAIVVSALARALSAPLAST